MPTWTDPFNGTAGALLDSAVWSSLTLNKPRYSNPTGYFQAQVAGQFSSAYAYNVKGQKPLKIEATLGVQWYGAFGFGPYNATTIAAENAVSAYTPRMGFSGYAHHIDKVIRERDINGNYAVLAQGTITSWAIGNVYALELTAGGQLVFTRTGTGAPNTMTATPTQSVNAQDFVPFLAGYDAAKNTWNSVTYTYTAPSSGIISPVIGSGVVNARQVVGRI